MIKNIKRLLLKDMKSPARSWRGTVIQSCSCIRPPVMIRLLPSARTLLLQQEQPLHPQSAEHQALPDAVR